MFPAFLNRNRFRADLEKAAPKGLGKRLSADTPNEPPPLLRKVFRNPAMPYSTVETMFLNQDGPSPIDNLRAAFHGAPNYVMPWFRVGQAVMMALAGSVDRNESDYLLLLETVRMRFMDAHIGEDDGDEILRMCKNHYEAVRRQDPQWYLKVQNFLNEIAHNVDEKERPVSPKDSLTKLAMLAVFLSIALGGFYALREYYVLPILWLIFFIVAVPLGWAFFFEHKALDGKTLVQIYRIGVGSIPLIGKLIRALPHGAGPTK
jgi:hypothetical protein